ncbi:major urinary protein 20 [Phodopus roborovskii]|uniref:Mup20 protein n=1 Tax=Phodopus roborovskii TaxID=109678 RepID=A0AAU9ZDV5_PHORO|nr:major urinary protein 20 [Phodopus roborovskii]CAH6790437.1 Mup20 [Phodopus roborovskii]
MKLLQVLLLLGLEMMLVCVHAEGKTSLIGKNFNPEKIDGEWYTIGLASDKREKIEEHGSMRVFVEYIHFLKNSSLAYKFHIIENGKCNELYLVTDKTEEDGEYEVKYDGYNRYIMLDVDYNDYIIVRLVNIKNGETFQLMELYGRTPDLSSNIKRKFGDISKMYGIPEENIFDLTKSDRCLHARGRGKALAFRWVISSKNEKQVGKNETLPKALVL